MKAINTANYTTDRHYERVVAAVQTLIERHRVIRPIDVFVTMGLLTPQHVSDWQAGRILRILRLHAHDLKLRECTTVYQHRGHQLRFSKTHEPKVEEAYSRHFLRLNHAGSGSSADGAADHGPAVPCKTSRAPGLDAE